MLQFSPIQNFLLWAIPVLFAITFHEVAHGWVAKLRGDQTASRLGRLSPNPLRHIDLLGTIIVPALAYMVGGFIFGWAKPVPVQWNHLKSPRLDMALVAAAGPCANVLMMLIWALIAHLSLNFAANAPWPATILYHMGLAGIVINLMLILVNLIPIPPLDGSRVVRSFLTPATALQYDRLERFGLIILVILLVTGLLTKMIMPLFSTLFTWVTLAFGLTPMF